MCPEEQVGREMWVMRKREVLRAQPWPQPCSWHCSPPPPAAVTALICGSAPRTSLCRADPGWAAAQDAPGLKKWLRWAGRAEGRSGRDASAQSFTWSLLALFLWRQEVGMVTSLSRKLRKTLLTQKSLPVRTSAGCLLSPLLFKLLDVVE